MGWRDLVEKVQALGSQELQIFREGLQRPHVECPKLNFTVIMKSEGQG